MSSSHCSSCSHIVNGNVRNCPMCGATMHKNNKNDIERHCPRCKTKLEVCQFNHFQLDGCKTCHGLWIEPEKFKVLTSEFDVYRDDKSDPCYIKPAMPKSEGYLPCASCNKLMPRTNFKSISGVLIDSCLDCGIWLDKNELQHIRSFIASGGIDKSQDRELFNHSQQIEALDDRISDVELMEKMLHKFDLKRIFFRGF